MRHLLLLILMLSCIGCPNHESATNGDASDAIKGEPDGSVLYATYCSLCHGPAGEGYLADGANQLANQSWLSIASFDFIRSAIREGRPGTPMSAWGQERGGPLNDEQVALLVAHIQDRQTAPSVDLSGVTVDGVAERALAAWEFKCAGCHGEMGGGAEFMSVNNPVFLRDAADGYLKHSISHGRPGTSMQPYGSSLTPQAIEDLVVLIRSWQVPVDQTPVQSGPVVLGPVEINPDGPEPAFDAEGEFVSVDELKAALDAGARLGILDARATSDYIKEHIVGAVSVPFYDVAKSLDQLPKDLWLVAYCGCPHAASQAAVKVLKDNGYTRLKVLDEGIDVWKEKSYPVEAGE
jgi:cytochrome c oxidase cbb3-type subunit 3/ubiquinol-cytochrome c reductase cytochrome c subunit